MSEKFADHSVLVAELRQGNENAFKYLVNAYHQKLCVYAATLCHDEDQAEDIVQNVFFRLWRNRQNLSISRRFSSFLYRSVYNEFIDQFRQSRKVIALEKKHIDELSIFLDEEEDMELDRLKELVNQEIEKLPRKCKKVFLLSKKEGLSNIEIAEYLHISIKSVEAHISKAYKILKDRVEGNRNDNNKRFFLF
jgi:RNA polymerase sigma-70 factor (family 1)